MRFEFIPTVRGEMAFYRWTLATGSTTGGTTIFENVTGTTWSTSTINTDNTTDSLNSSLTSAKTLSSAVTAETSKSAFYTTTQTSSRNRTIWTTSSVATTNETQPTHTTVVTTVSFEDIVGLTATRSETRATTTSTSTVTANCYDTVYIAEGSEILLALTSPMYASSWNGDILNPLDYAVSTSRATIQADITSVSINVHNLTEASQIITSSSSQTLPVNTFVENAIPTATVADFGKFPNDTTTMEVTSLFFLIENTTTTIESPQSVLNHYGHTFTKKQWVEKYTTVVNMGVDDYRTASVVVPTVQLSTITTKGPESYFAELNAAGGTTVLNTDQRLEIGSFTDGTLQRLSPGIVAISKPRGVIAGTQSGLYYTLENTETTFSAQGAYALLERENDFNNGIVTLMTTQNQDFTLSGSNVTYTKTTATLSTTLTTTQGDTVAVTGGYESHFVGTKLIMGGKPEGNATFHQLIPGGAYFDQDSNFRTYTGFYSSWESSTSYSTFHLRNALALSFGGNVNFDQVVALSRNPSPL